jgi:ESF2/ABP1 family protein
MSNKEKTKDLFGLQDDSEGEDVSSSNEEEQEDSRFTKTRLNKLSLGNNDDSTDQDDSSDEETDVEDENETEDRTKTSTTNQDEKEEKQVDKTEDNGMKDNDADDTDTDDLEDIKGIDLPKELLKKKKSVLNPNVSRKQLKKLAPEALEQFEKAKKRTGVCYLSRIPLFMQPKQVRSALNKYATVGRIFLVPEGKKKKKKKKKKS